MNNFLKVKLSYASTSKPKRTRNMEHSSVLQSKENDCIYESILSGMGGDEKEYISDLIKCKRKKEGRSSHTKNVDDDSAEQNLSKVARQPVLRMNSPKLKHVQSLDEAEFLDEQPASAKYKSTNTSFVFTEKLLDKKERQNSERNLKVKDKSERDNFIGSLDGYIHKLESVEVSKIRESSDFKKDYEKKYKHLVETYMEQISSSKQKEEKLVSYIKNLKKYVRDLEEKVMQNEEKQKSFNVLWRRREEQFGILMGIEREIKEHIYGESEMDEPSTLDIESYEEEDSNIRHTLKFNPKEIRSKSRHTVNYH